MKKSILVTVVLMAVSGILNGENLVSNGDAENSTKGWDNDIKIVTDAPHSGSSCFLKDVSKWAMLNDFIPIDYNNKYKFSGWFKSKKGDKQTLYISIIPFDENKKQIKVEEVYPLKGSETKLVSSCKPSDTILKIEDGSNWKFDPLVYLVAFKVDSSGKYRDLPNKNITKAKVISIEKKKKYYLVKLDKPCGITASRGTKIREHIIGPTYIHPTYKQNFASKNWVEVSGTLQGEAPVAKRKLSIASSFWPGTKFIKIGFVYKDKLYFDDIKFEIVK